MSSREVTVDQFRTFVAATGYRTEAERDGEGGTGLIEPGRFGQQSKFTWKELGFPIMDNHPVVNVSWNDAQAFCKWLSKKDECTYRLPTETEWEFACRAGTTTRFSCGDETKDLFKHANVSDQTLASVTPGLPWPTAFEDGAAYLAEVAQYQPNSFGLYDMHGNVLEWCETRFSIADPLEHLAPPATAEVLYCLRGGNWFNDANHAGSACRTGAPPQLRMSLIGFRVLREIPDTSDN